MAKVNAEAERARRREGSGWISALCRNGDGEGEPVSSLAVPGDRTNGRRHKPTQEVPRAPGNTLHREGAQEAAESPTLVPSCGTRPC